MGEAEFKYARSYEELMDPSSAATESRQSSEHEPRDSASDAEE